MISRNLPRAPVQLSKFLLPAYTSSVCAPSNHSSWFQLLLHRTCFLPGGTTRDLGGFDIFEDADSGLDYKNSGCQRRSGADAASSSFDGAVPQFLQYSLGG